MTRYAFYFYTGGIALEGIEVKADSLKEASWLVEQKLIDEHSDLLYNDSDIKGFAEEAEMLTGDYIYSYGYVKLGKYYTRLKGIAYGNRFLPVN